MISVALLAAVVAFSTWGLYLVVAGSVPGKVLGVLLVLIGLELRPRLPRLKTGLVRTTRTASPELFNLVDRVAAEVGAPRIDVIVLDDSFNAWCGRYGLRRRPALGLGLPLWVGLSNEARLALLGHELGHLVNGDPGQKLVTAPALFTFGRIANVLNPRGLIHTRGMNGIYGLSARFMTRLVITPLWWLMVWVHVGIWRIAAPDHQRAELHADALAVEVGGSAGAHELMTVLLLSESVWYAVRRGARTSELATEWTTLALAAVDQPEDVLRRREQHSIRVDASVLASHPPAGLRRRLVRSWAAGSGDGPAHGYDFDAVDAELAPVYRRIRPALATA